MIQITFHGAARTVTGSRHLLQVNGHQVLLDCGLYQGRRRDSYQVNLNFPFDPATVNALIVSHAHVDHLGNIPNLVKQGFNGDIHSTSATSDLANVMLYDSAHVHESDAKFVSKIRGRHHEPPVEPLFRVRDVPPALELFQSHRYNRWFQVVNGVRTVFKDAGHILGSAITLMQIEDTDRSLTICFTGDLGRKKLPIIRDPFVVDKADVLIIESTYGDRLHADIGHVQERLARVINETVDRGGKIIVPSFALERTQELVYSLHRLKLDNKVPDIPVYVDSPLAIDATDVFRLHPECFDAEMNEFVRTVDDPFGFNRLHYTRTADQSMALNWMKGPMIIIAGSGMAEAGRVLHHLKNGVEDPRNTVLIVGWQAQHTLGRKIAEKWNEVPIFGESYKLAARVEVFDEFSAHADRDDLLSWVSRGKDKWQRVFVVHGDESASLSLAQAMREMGLPDVAVPELGQSFVL